MELVISLQLVLTITTTMVVCLLWRWWWLEKPSQKRKGRVVMLRAPPGPTPWPILGNLVQLGRHPHANLASMARTYGPLISLKLGCQRLVVASSPSAAAHILKTHDRVFCTRFISHSYRVEGYIDHSFIFSFDCNERWKRLRTLCKAELFTARIVESQARMRESKVQHMLLSLSAASSPATGVRIGEYVFTTVFNITGNVFFSRDVLFNYTNYNSSSNGHGVVVGDAGSSSCHDETLELRSHISKILELGMVPNVGDFYPWLAWMDIQGLNREAKAFVARIYRVWDELIGDRLVIASKKSDKQRQLPDDHDHNPQQHNNNGYQDFLSVWIDAGITEVELKALLLDMFVAGTDTTTTVVDWTMSELIRNPNVMRKLKDELKQVVGEPAEGAEKMNAVKDSHLGQLTYLEACIKESLRLHPPVPLLLPRQALDHCQVMGYTIPKDSRVMINVWAIGRDPQVWEEPTKFWPERFLGSSIDYKGSDFELVPFGGGRRMCAGLPLASRVVKLILAALIHTFEWGVPDGMQPSELSMEERFGLTLERKQPLLLVPK